MTSGEDGATVADEGAPSRATGAAATRAALLAAARELFAAQGFDRTTVRGIAERAGVNQALLFRYFGSKDALFAAALSEQAHALAAEAPPEDLLATTLRRIMQPTGGPGDADLLLALLRSPGESRATNALRDALAGPYRAALATLSTDDGPDAVLRAELLLAWLLGIAFARSVLEVPILVEADAEATVAHVERAARALLGGP